MKLCNVWEPENIGIFNLFYGFHPSNPQLAANAIERYVYDHDHKPWRYDINVIKDLHWREATRERMTQTTG